MTVFNGASQISFHDSTLHSISNNKKRITIYLSGIYIDDINYSVNVSIENVECITQNDIKIGKLTMETDDGAVIRFHKEDNDIILALTWTKHSPHSEEFRLYRFHGANIVAEVHDIKPAE